MNCVVCLKSVVMPGAPNPNFVKVTKYWSINEDGSRRPYCSCACGLTEYTHDLADKDTPPSKS